MVGGWWWLCARGGISSRLGDGDRRRARALARSRKRVGSRREEKERERERETERERKGRTERRERSRDTVFAARRVRSLVYVYLAEKERLSARAVRRIKKKKGESACYVCLTTNPVT